MPPQTFRATLQLDGRTATGIEVPADVVEALDGGRQPLVKVTLAEHAYRSKVAVRAGVYKLPVSAEHRAAAGVQAGDEVEVTLELDTEPREVLVPPALAEALAGDDTARAFWGELTASQQRWYTAPIETAKTDDTRRRRVEKALDMLREGRRR